VIALHSPNFPRLALSLAPGFAHLCLSFGGFFVSRFGRDCELLTKEFLYFGMIFSDFLGCFDGF
jgi:hypothetical protein